MRTKKLISGLMAALFVMTLATCAVAGAKKELMMATSLQYEQLKVISCCCTINQLQPMQFTNTKVGIVSMILR